MIMARWYMKTATVSSEFVGHDQGYAGVTIKGYAVPALCLLRSHFHDRRTQ